MAQAVTDIHIKGAKVHNLKDVEVRIPRNRLTVVTGVSGSGKSSLVFDTLYAEGHRRYVESLSAYARQFLSRLPKPEVDFITGLSPAIAIEQRTHTGNPRSSVGSVTEIYDYLRLLFARAGETFSPISGEQVHSDSVTSIAEDIFAREPDTPVHILSALHRNPKRKWHQELEVTLQKGFTRLFDDGQVLSIEELLAQGVPHWKEEQVPYLLVDRFRLPAEVSEEFSHRVADSLSTALAESSGRCWVQLGNDPIRHYSELFERDGLTFEKPTEQFFNYNNPYGACPRCEGFGRIIGIDEDLVIPDTSKSVYDGAVAPWKGEQMGEYRKYFLKQAVGHDFPVHRAYADLSETERELLWHGGKNLQGIYQFFEDVERQTYKVQYRVMLARYRGYARCPECRGSRLRKETSYVKVGGYSIAQLLEMPIIQLREAFRTLALTPYQEQLSKRILTEIRSRLDYLCDVGVGYLTLSRKANTLSGGETQRIQLATSLGSSLVGSLYILDEPSIGLHPQDGDRLLKILENLRDLGNTVIVVEHDEAAMARANYLVDMGPYAGELGGQVVAVGDYASIRQNPESLTGRYLSGQECIPLPLHRRQPQGWMHLQGAQLHNLQGVDVSFPTGVLTVVTGVSGSGKSTLVQQILYPALRQHLALPADKPGIYTELAFEGNSPAYTEAVGQDALSRNQRSNAVTYTGAYDFIRELYASQPEAKQQSLKPAHFSFNVDGGRCDTCKGDGMVTVQMQFLPDVKLPCDTCKGKRFKQVVLDVYYNGKNIADVLEMTVTEALSFFAQDSKIAQRLRILEDVGLGYVRLGQSTSNLSGGESQRLKLASFLSSPQAGHAAYIFDEPTTGLHFHDVRKLMEVLARLVDAGNTVIIIEHNLDVMKCADWLIDMGPGGGDQGGQLVYAGPPEGIVTVARSATGPWLNPKLS
ncbi:MAG: excinuclease ABC subunit UvrA [Bacteroidetes bacterium]|nr:excinuclease ABC subunit UvrA [Bacteroidota bacterium]